jgi:integrase
MKRLDRKENWLHVIRDKTAADTDMAFIRIEMTDQLKEIWQRAWEDGIPCPFLVHYRPKSQRPQHMQNKLHPFAVTPDYLTKTFKAIRDETGIYNHLAPRQRPTFHEIRSLSARIYRELGYADEYIRSLMTHTDKKTTEIYLQNPEHLDYRNFRPVKAEMKLKDLPRI